MAVLASALTASGSWAGIDDPTATPAWTMFESGFFDSTDSAEDTVVTADGSVYVCGYRGSASGDTEVTLTRYRDGARTWGPVSYNGAGNSGDKAWAVAVGPNGAVYTAGSSGSFASGGLDVLLVKWAAKTGKRVWVRHYRGPAGKNDSASKVGVDRAGNVTILGSVTGADDAYDALLRSYTPSGKVRWTWRSDWSDAASDTLSDLLVRPDGSVYATGFIYSPGPQKPVTVRFSAAGKRLWTRTYVPAEGMSASMRALAARPGGGVYCCGWTETAVNEQDGIVLAYTAKGARTVFTLDMGSGGASHQGFDDIAVTSSGYVVAAGYDFGPGSAQPRYTVYDASGAIGASRTIASADSATFTRVAADAFGGYYVSGTRSLVAGQRRILTLRGITRAGAATWTSLYNPVSADGNKVNGLAVGGTTVAVVGRADFGAATGIDQLVAVYQY